MISYKTFTAIDPKTNEAIPCANEATKNFIERGAIDKSMKGYRKPQTQLFPIVHGRFYGSYIVKHPDGDIECANYKTALIYAKKAK